MGVELLEVGFAFPYSDGCTPDGLRSLLLRLAAAWPGWHSFPWRVTRNIHHLLRGPEAKFSYLMMQRCLTGYAAHLVLTAPFEDRDAVLRMMAKTRFEAGGLLLDLLMETVRAEMRRTGLPYIPDASGPEDGHVHVDAEEIARRRTAFRAAMDGMAKEFRTILNVASLTDCRPGTVCLGRRMETWARGVDMPEPVTLEVQAEDRGRYRILMPCAQEVEALANAGKRVPRLIEGDVRAAREECAALGWGGKRVEKSVGVCGCGSEGKVNSERSTVNSGSRQGKGEGKRVGVCGGGSVCGNEAVSSGSERSTPNAEGCGGEMVLRARGMTVVALPARDEERDRGGGTPPETNRRAETARERAATELDGRETGKRVGVCEDGRAGKVNSGSGQREAAKPVARVFGDFHRIELPSGRMMALHQKHKRRAFLRAAHAWCEKNKTDAFDWETVIEEHNARYSGRGDENRRIKSDRVDDDLFKGQKEEFKELFGEPDRANGRLRFAVRLEFG
jgi:hypothetical protein